MDREPTPRTTSNLRISAAAGLLNSVGSIAAVAIFGRALIGTVGLERYGAWGVVALVASLPTLLDFGFARESVLRIVSAPGALARRRAMSDLVAYAALTSFIAVVLAELFVVYGVGITDQLGAGDLFHIAGAVSLAVLASGALGAIRALAEAIDRLSYVALSSLAQTVLTYSLAAGAAALLPSPSAVYYSYPVALVLVLLGSAPIVRTIAVRLGRPLRPCRASILATLRAGSGHGWNGALSYAVIPLNRAFILHQPDSLAISAVFDVLTRICESAAAVLTSAFTPLYRYFLQPLDAAHKRSLVLRCEVAAAAAFVAGVAVYTVLARPILGYLLGVDASGLTALAVTALACRAVHGIAEPTVRLLWSHGNKRVVLLARIAALALNLVFLAALGAVLPLEWAAGLAYSAPFVVSGALIVILGRAVLPEFNSDLARGGA